jgi:peptide methionine sulfoxide reductase msrA/msrB
MQKNTLTSEQKNVLINKGTEAPFSGAYDDFYQKGVYVCGWCNTPLYNSESKFDAGCGWPAFDDEIPGSVARHDESDGRTEITCAHCGGHLGHVFNGEYSTPKNVRHCVNSLALQFIPEEQELPPVADNK